MSTSESRTAEGRTLDSIDNYKMTLGSMCALAHVLERHYGAESHIAPTMYPSPRNKIQTTDSVTPDMMSQGRNVNLVVELKRSLPNNKSGRIDALNQIVKYDDNLTGWKKNPRIHDIMLMTHMSKSAHWADFLAEVQVGKKATFDRNISVVEYVRDSERETYFILKKVWGKTSNSALDKYLRYSIVVKAEQLIKKISVAKFCDSKPDVAYTMSILWNQIFPALITKDMHLTTRGRKAVDGTFELREIIDKTKESEGSFSYPPREAWITEALNALVGLKMAERRPDGRFLVHYKSVRGDLVEFFVKKLVKSTVRKKQGRKKQGRKKQGRKKQGQEGDIRDYFQKP